jgi:hypothetical protein
MYVYQHTINSEGLWLEVVFYLKPTINIKIKFVPVLSHSAMEM